ncbi:chemotaxis protein CheW [Dasania marina]|uniref:chemotaxis protein CheW n=1 Tax=Dasania marina TaxID=471499 RepID=UPI0030D7A0BF|tara:strand:- start:12327 stop:12869 length:543 start_codon:yes stop_codon:yes gene_type:complete
MSKQLQAFATLQDIASRSLQLAKGLPAQANVVPLWSGIGFTLGGYRFVAPMGEVSEILVQPPATRLPGVKPWVRGVSNVRGKLLPLIDLEVFFGGALSGGRKNHRVLSLELGELYTGLIVNEVHGMQHFPVDTFSNELPAGVEALAPFLAGSYQQNGDTWVVFSTFKLAQNADFMNAAAS